MEALQADIARRINKRRHSDSDSEMSIQKLLRPPKRARHSSKPLVTPSKLPPLLGPNVRVSPTSSASSCTVIDDNGGRKISSDASREVSTTDKSSDEEDSLLVSSSISSESDSDTDAISSEGGEESNVPVFADRRISTNSDIGSSSSDDEENSNEDDERVEEEENESDSEGDGSLPSESSASSDRSSPLSRPLPGVDFLHHLIAPVKPGNQTESKARNWSGGLTRENGTTLKSRLDKLLPEMREANEELEVERREGRLGERDIEVLGEGSKGYVEMELGLGVLEEKKEGEGEAEEGEKGEGSDADRVEDGRALLALLPGVEKGGCTGMEVLEDEL